VFYQSQLPSKVVVFILLKLSAHSFQEENVILENVIFLIIQNSMIFQAGHHVFSIGKHHIHDVQLVLLCFVAKISSTDSFFAESVDAKTKEKQQ